MRLLLHISLLLLFIFGCTDDNSNMALDSMASNDLKGSWKRIETFSGLALNQEWTAVPDSLQIILKFRGDGIQIDDDGLPTCCRATKYIINTKLFELKDTNESNAKCQGINCVGCQILEMDLTSDQLIISGCVLINGKYKRI